MTATALLALLLSGVAAAPTGAVRPVQFIPPNESGFMLPSVPVDTLQKSRDCETSLPTFGHPDAQYWPPHGAITMSNDGGWCWLQFGQSFRANVFVPNATIVERPAHGELDVEKMKDRVSLAYRPTPGFAGADRFVVQTDGPLPHTIPVAVEVR